jgi:SAM-dependent methyltransferase
MTDLERPKGSTNHPLIALSDENIAVAEAMGVNAAIHENDFIFHFMDRLWAANGGRERAVKEYFTHGRYSADLIKTMITDVPKVYEGPKSDWAPRRVLDFASGYGCTARHLRHVLPDSICGTCDIHLDAVNFTKDVLGVESYISSPVPEQLKLPPQDVIFAHSFFSHMPESTWARWLKALANALAPGGVLIFTTHGFALDKLGYPGLTVKANGFGFIPQSEQDDLDTAQYGLTISYPRWVLAVLALMPELRLTKFHEGLWWGTHGTQDTYVCVKEPDPLPGCPPSAPNHPTTPAHATQHMNETAMNQSALGPAAIQTLAALLDDKDGRKMFVEAVYSAFLEKHTSTDRAGNIDRAYNIDSWEIGRLAAAIESHRYASQKMIGVPRFQDRNDLLNFACKNITVDGPSFEFGVWSGHSVNLIASLLPSSKVYGFDSFEGLPEAWFGKADGIGVGLFSRNGELPQVRENVELVVGWFDHVLAPFLNTHEFEKIALLHIDCDIYSSAQSVFSYLYKKIVPGTIIVFDEYFNYPTWQRHEYAAFQEYVAYRQIKYEYFGLVPGDMQVAVRILSV